MSPHVVLFRVARAENDDDDDDNDDDDNSYTRDSVRSMRRADAETTRRGASAFARARGGFRQRAASAEKGGRAAQSRAAGQTQSQQRPQKTETIKRDQPKIGRNDRVTIKNVANGESKTVKYKQAIPLIENGTWVLTNHS